ncbi:MAG TPA: hypothetical protein VLA23_12100, partial [Candidatus Limnocylindrales bacterium]|nr:hypothetical protein [Candidatus Limnocylindrales bacterium]
MQDDLLERVAAVRDDEEPAGGPTSREGLLDRATAGDDLLVLGDPEERRRGGSAEPLAGRDGTAALVGAVPAGSPARLRPRGTRAAVRRTRAAVRWTRAAMIGRARAAVRWARAAVRWARAAMSGRTRAAVRRTRAAV